MRRRPPSQLPMPFDRELPVVVLPTPIVQALVQALADLLLASAATAHDDEEGDHGARRSPLTISSGRPSCTCANRRPAKSAGMSRVSGVSMPSRMSRATWASAAWKPSTRTWAFRGVASPNDQVSAPADDRRLGRGRRRARARSVASRAQRSGLVAARGARRDHEGRADRS